MNDQVAAERVAPNKHRRVAVHAATVAQPAPVDRTRIAPVSTVVPCFRCAETIGSAVASAAAQMVRPAEVLLVDDGSGDGTLDRLHEIARLYPPGWVKVFALPRNQGPSRARNVGWENASQPWIAFLDADDTWHPLKLKLQMDALAENPDVYLLTHRMNVQTRDAPPPPLRYPLKVEDVSPHLLHLRSPFQTDSIVLRRDLPFRFDENRRRAEDFFLWAQILLSGYRCVRVNQVLASVHKPAFGASGLSGDLAGMYQAGVDARKSLHELGLLSRWQLHATYVLGLMRYARRRVLTFTRHSPLVRRLKLHVG